jgi:hypothetical protein
MNDRRGFLRPSVLAAGAAVLADSSESLASTEGFPAGIVYTAAKPGKWAGREDGHAPKITMDGRKVTVTTAHPMSEKHCHVRHTLVAGDSEAVSSFDLPEGSAGSSGPPASAISTTSG